MLQYPVMSNFKLNETKLNTLEKLCCCPGKTNCIHGSRNTGFFGKLNKVIFPSQPKTHFFRDILPERVPCSIAVNEGHALALALVNACTGAFFLEKCPNKEFHHCLCQQEKKLSETCTNPEVRFLAQKYSAICPNCLLRLWRCLA